MKSVMIAQHSDTEIVVRYSDGITMVYFVGDIAGELTRRWNAFEVAVGRNVATAQLLTIAQRNLDDATRTLSRAAAQLERAL